MSKELEKSLLTLEEHFINTTHKNHLIAISDKTPIFNILYELNKEVFNKLKVLKIEYKKINNINFEIFILKVNMEELQKLLIDNALKNINEGFEELTKQLREDNLKLKDDKREGKVFTLKDFDDAIKRIESDLLPHKEGNLTGNYEIETLKMAYKKIENMEEKDE